MTDFRLLGPLEVAEAGERLALPAGQPRALLARLLLDANRALSADVLVDSIWGEAPPPSARKVLQAYVSQLRKVLGGDRIETHAAGYVVRVRPPELDLARFEALTEAAQTAAEPARRSSLLADALSLWRGPPLAEFRDEPFAAVAARRLGDLRISALEQRVEADLELGRHERVVPELEALVAQEPLRERPRSQLMVALYRSGRQAEALACYRDARRRIVEELGVEPSNGLQEVERAILRQDPALDLTAKARGALRGPVVATSAVLLELLLPLCTGGRELLLVVVADAAQVPSVAACDVALAHWPAEGFAANAPVVVPFGGGREEWAALELGAWLARAHGLPLRLLGADATEERRDASRLLANASLALQRFTQTPAEPVLIPPGPEAVLAQESSAIVTSLPAGEVDASRRRLVEEATVPVLLVRPGLRPSGVAPDYTLTRFSWSLDNRP